jgi:hypothetical protein
MGIFSGGSFPTSGGTVIITQDGYQTLNLTGNILTISGSNSSVDLSSYLDDTNTTNTSLTLNASNVLTLTDSDSGTVTVDLTSLVTAAGGTAESTHIPVKNTSGATITKGTPVYITGNVGSSNRLQIAPADASDPAKMPAIGLLETDLINNAEGYVVQGGYLTNITTDIIDGTSTSSNDTVYVKVGGGITMTKPTGSTNYIQNIAKVARVGSGSSGSLIVSSILRTNDIPNLADGQVWVGSTTYPVSTDFNLQEVTDGGNTTTNDITIGGGGTTATDAVLILDGGNASGGEAYISLQRNSVGGFLLNHSDSSIQVRGTTDLPMYFYTNNSIKQTILSNGNIGIGTTTPGEKLEVAGNILLTTNTGASRTLYTGGDTNLHIQTNTGDVKILSSNGGNNLMTLLNGGNIGINESSPDAKLHIVGSGNTSGTTALLVENSSGDDLLQITDGGNAIMNVNYLQLDEFVGGRYLKIAPAISGDTHKIESNSGSDIVVSSSNGNTLIIGGDGQHTFPQYTSTNFDGTPTSFLGVDASGNVVKTTSAGVLTPTLQQVTTAGNTTTDDVGIQMSNPVSALHIGDGNNTLSSALYTTDIVNVSAQNTAPGVNIISAGTSQYNRGVFKATRAKGSLATPLTVVNNDYVFSLLGAAYNGTANYATAGVEMFVDGTVTSTLVPQRIEFQTGTGTSRSTRMTIKSSGDVKVGGGSPSAKFHILSKGTTSATTGLLVESNIGTDLLKVTDDGAVQLGVYGSGTFTGTAAYTLAVDSSGNIIETSGGGGGTPDLDAVTTAGNTTTNSITIGSATAGTAKVNIVGADATDANDALLVENSSGNDLFKITNSGNFYMSHATRTNSIVINNVDTTGTGTYSTILGYQAADGTNVNGLYLTAIGTRAAQIANGGTYSVAVGMNAARNCQGFSSSVVVGMNAVNGSQGFSNSVAVGRSAAEQSKLNYSTVVGYYAGRALGTTQRNYNTYIGWNVASSSNNESGNTFIGAYLQTSSTEALNNTVIIGSYNQERLRIDSTGKFKFDSYGSGSFTGTATVNLEADSSGNVIERLEERGTFSGTTDSGGRLNISHSIGVTPTIAMITTDAVGGSTIVTASVISKTSTTVTIITNQASTAISGYYIFSE